MKPKLYLRAIFCVIAIFCALALLGLFKSDVLHCASKVGTGFENLDAVLMELNDRYLSKRDAIYGDMQDKIMQATADASTADRRLRLARRFADGTLDLALIVPNYDERIRRMDNYSRLWLMAYDALLRNGESAERLLKFFQLALQKQKEVCFSADAAEKVENWLDARTRLNRASWMRDYLKNHLGNIDRIYIGKMAGKMDGESRATLKAWFQEFSKTTSSEIEMTEKRQKSDWPRLIRYTPPELRLKPNFKLKVVDDKGIGIGNASVHIMGIDGGMVRRSESGQTDDDGCWVPPYGMKSFGFSARKNGYESKSMSVDNLPAPGEDILEIVICLSSIDDKTP